MRLPTGLSITQAKKDAKKLVKQSKIALFEAQNIVARKHSRSDWPTMMESINKKSTLSVSLKQSSLTRDTIQFPSQKSVTTVVGPPARGKTLLLLEFSAQWLKQGIPVVYIGSLDIKSSSIPDHRLDVQAASRLKSQHGSLFRIFDNQAAISSIKLDGAVLIIEELNYLFGLFGSIDPADLRELINTSFHTFIGCHDIVETKLLTYELKNICDENLHFIVMMRMHFSIFDNLFDFHSLTSNLETDSEALTTTGDYREFLSVSNKVVRKLRFRLKDHTAL